MTPPWIKVGAVFRWKHDQRPGRILVHDGTTAMYDAWWPHLDAWGHADLATARRGAVSYYVTLTSTLLAKADFVRYEPLSGGEEALHRPDLPFAVARRPAAWPTAISEVAPFAAAIGTPAALSIPELYLRAFGPNGDSKGAVRVTADDGSQFAASELMRKAAEIQMTHLGSPQIVDGAGIYRQGLHRGRPCFYLWGATSKLESHLAEFERSRAAHRDTPGDPRSD